MTNHQAVLGRAVRGLAPVTEPATPPAMVLPTLPRHLRVLEGSGLIGSLNPAALEETAQRLARHRLAGEAQLDRRVTRLRQEENGHGCQRD